MPIPDVPTEWTDASGALAQISERNFCSVMIDIAKAINRLLISQKTPIPAIAPGTPPPTRCAKLAPSAVAAANCETLNSTFNRS